MLISLVLGNNTLIQECPPSIQMYDGMFGIVLVVIVTSETVKWLMYFGQIAWHPMIFFLMTMGCHVSNVYIHIGPVLFTDLI